LRRRGLTPVDWAGWLRVDTAERASGADRGRDRIKVADRQTLVALAHARTADDR
jgi:ferredoxin--NADP+ reductase